MPPRTSKPKKPRPSRAKGTGGKSAPRKAGTPAHAPTEANRRDVAVMAAVGTPQEVIARLIGIADDTLRRHYADELKSGREQTIAEVSQSLVNQARRGNVGAAAFYLKTQAGWREKDEATAATVNLLITRATLDEPAEQAQPSVTPVPAGHPVADGTEPTSAP